jgi:hypothetical protein
MSENPANFTAFWPYYLAAHADPRTRAVHYCGTALAFVLLVAFVTTGSLWLLPAIPVAGYAPAWLAHSHIEHNRPATFGHPLWSLIGDFRMFYLAGTGQLTAELERLGLYKG